MNKKDCSSKKVRDAFPWRLYSWICSGFVGIGIWALFYFKMSRLGPENPYHPFDPAETAGFGLVFGGLGAAMVKFLIIDKVLSMMAEKQSAVEIAEEVAMDVARAAVGVAVEGIVDGVTGSSGSDSSESLKGRGGEFGGGGATGGY